MTQKEFNKLNVGDKVRIARKKVGRCWAPNGEMDKWIGKVMTVSTLHTYFVCMEEDKWHWFPEMIDCKVDEKQPLIDFVNSLSNEELARLKEIIKEREIKK